ncbi:MAG: hypothetical protein V4735_09265 [Pseudomonadota bacterium]
MPKTSVFVVTAQMIQDEFKLSGQAIPPGHKTLEDRVGEFFTKNGSDNNTRIIQLSDEAIAALKDKKLTNISFGSGDNGSTISIFGEKRHWQGGKEIGFLLKASDVQFGTDGSIITKKEQRALQTPRALNPDMLPMNIDQLKKHVVPTKGMKLSETMAPGVSLAEANPVEVSVPPVPGGAGTSRQV